MAVEVCYKVVRDGVERMTFTSKKEADAYDKMLDIAEALESMLSEVDLHPILCNLEKFLHSYIFVHFIY